MRVPLIFHGPGVPAGRVVADPVQIVDMPATVLDVAGTGLDALGDGSSFAAALRKPDWMAPGEYHLENEYGVEQHEKREFVFNGVREGPWKLVLTERNAYRPGPWEPELYNLAQDPGEEHNLFHREEHRERIERMLGELRDHVGFLDETGFRGEAPAALSPETQAQLNALGYAQN